MTALVLGDLLTTGVNLATGIYANGSIVTLESDSVVAASAVVTENNNGVNLSTGIGSNVVGESLPFQNNVFTFNQGTSIKSLAQIDGNNLDGINAATTIGQNLVGTSSSDFTGNTFTLNFTRIEASFQLLIRR